MQYHSCNTILCNLHSYMLYYVGKKGIAHNLKTMSSKMQPVILIIFQEYFLLMNITYFLTLFFLKILKYSELKVSVVLLYLRLIYRLFNIERFALKWASCFQLTSPASKGIRGLQNEVQ